jgi:GNAT superfamily N-acetyltransferase
MEAIIDATVVSSDLTPADLPNITWAGGPAYLDSVERYLARVASGEVDYLCLRTPDGDVAAKGCIDYAVSAPAGKIQQMATRVKGRGLGTRLIQLLEERMRQRGIATAVLDVEDVNPRALALYERLGYRVTGSRKAAWERDVPGGRAILESTCIIMQKDM